MREIKFRAWDKEGREFIDLWTGNCNETLNEIFDMPEYDFQQYTGLKDKNGKEIYEGDILAENYGVEFVGKQVSYTICTVSFGEWYCECRDYYCNEDGVGFYVDGFTRYYRKDGSIDTYWVRQETLTKHYRSYEVIGNIYENPEILEKK